MASVTVRDLTDEVRGELRRIAAAHGRSMEAELRALIIEHVARHRRRPTLAEAAATFREHTGGVDLQLMPRETPAVPDLSDLP